MGVDGRWESEFKLQNLKNGKTHRLALDIYSINQKKLRIDATALLGIYVASFLMVGDEVSLLIAPEKTFYTGAPSEEGLAKILKVPFHPKILYDLLFDRPIAGSQWKCEIKKADEAGFCQRSDQNVKVSWVGSASTRKKIEIEHPNAKVEFNMKFKGSLSEKDSSPFVLNAPERFQRKTLL